MTEPSKQVSWRSDILHREIYSDERLPESSKWLDQWPIPLLPRKSIDRDRILEMLQTLDEFMTVEVFGTQPSEWANSYMGQTLIGLIKELKGVRDGEWSKVLSPDKSRRGNRRRAQPLARLMIKAECVFAVDFFTPAFGSPRKAKDAISAVANGLG